MTQLAIRCHPGAPGAANELEEWLERQVDELGAAAPDATIRLSRLAPSGTDDEPGVGWLVELKRANGGPLLPGHRLTDALRDMRLLGLEPTLLAPRDAAANGGAA